MLLKPKRITSSSNIAVKEAAKLKRKRNRYIGRLFLAEGEDLLDAALRRGVLPRQVFVLEGYEGAVGEALAAAVDRPRCAAYIAPPPARVAELVDALASGASG